MSEFDVMAAERRDFRHCKGDPEVPPHRNRNNRRKVCKKSPDKEHAYREKTEEIIPGRMFTELTCVHCGRIVLGRGRDVRIVE